MLVVLLYIVCILLLLFIITLCFIPNGTTEYLVGLYDHILCETHDITYHPQQRVCYRAQG